MPKNVYGEPLEICSMEPVTGFTRSGSCETGNQDLGSHTVCAVMTEQFLQYSQACGNDLSTPVPEFGFAGLKPGDQWCLCAARWKEAFDAGMAPKVRLMGTHEKALQVVDLQDLKKYAVDLS